MSRTSRQGIESPIETCVKSRVHWMSAVFSWATGMGRLHDLDGLVDWGRADWTDSRGPSYGSLGGLVVQSECVARTVDSKKRIRPLSVCDRGISYALGDTFMLCKAVATVVGRTGNDFLCRRNEAYVVSSIKHRCLVKEWELTPNSIP
ncbi:hypothetical protein Salat_2118100 [Sesamum alatum]|uniref:Uncharacterized protein n=1 Tax=Sesamum alatum TaxID=300844 RepID=A0AAE1Y0W2_9LAMI|nr:hypothetical protein Salat_2118100 [Sesamum alatum]